MENLFRKTLFKSLIPFGVGLLHSLYTDTNSSWDLRSPSTLNSTIQHQMPPSEIPLSLHKGLDAFPIAFVGYEQFAIAAILLEAAIFTIWFIIKRSDRTDIPLFICESERIADTPQSEGVKGATCRGPFQSKMIILYILKCILFYMIGYIICMSTLSIASNFYIRQKDLMQTADMQESKDFGEVFSSSSGISHRLEENKQPRMNRRILDIPTPEYQTSWPCINIDLGPAVILLPSNDHNFAFVANIMSDMNYALQVINIPNPNSYCSIVQNVSYTSEFPLFDDLGLLLSSDGNTLFMTVSSAIHIINVTDPSLPNIIANHTSSSNDTAMHSIVLSPDENTLFYTVLSAIDNVDSRLNILNISTLSSPELLVSFELDLQDVSDLHLNEDILYIRGSLNFNLVNVSNVSNPFIIASQVEFPALDCPYIPVFSQDYKIAYLVLNYPPIDNSCQMNVLNVSNFTNPTFIISNCSCSSPNDDIFNVLMSPDGRHLFVNSMTMISVFDVSNPSSPNFIEHLSPAFPLAMGISADGQILLTFTENSEILVAQLWFNIEGDQDFDIQYPILDTISIDNASISATAISPDGNTIYVALNSYIVKVLDVSNPASIIQKSSITLESLSNGIVISSNGKTLYSVASAPGPDGSSPGLFNNSILEAYDIARNSLIFSITLNYPVLASFAISSDENTLFFISYYNLTGTIYTTFVIGNISDLNNLVLLSMMGFEPYDSYPYYHSFALSKDEKKVFVAGFKYVLFDISNLSSPQQMSEMGNTVIYSLYVALSSDQNFAYVYHFDINIGPMVTIFDISSPYNMTSSQSAAIPFDGTILDANSTTSRKIALSKDDQTLYIAAGGIIIMDVSTPTSPTVIGGYELLGAESSAVYTNNNTAFIIDNTTKLTAVNIKPNYMVNIPNNYLLGDTSSEFLNILQKNIDNTYDATMFEYKVINILLYNAMYNYPNPGVNTTYQALPSWITFSEGLNTITFAPNSASQMQNYTLMLSFSTFLSTDSFINISEFNTPTKSLELTMDLVSWGYIDLQGFLTSNFNPSSRLSLSSEYIPYESQIRNILATAYVATTISFSVTSSLWLTLKAPNITISSLSRDPLDVSINLITNDDSAQAMFVALSYFPVPSFTNNQSGVSIAGPLLDINAVLGQIVIFLNNTDSCDGNITISDNLNPILNQYITNISSYFTVSAPPAIDMPSFKAQINKVSIQTGVQFIIQFDLSTFTDPQNEALTLSLEMADGSLPPEWLDVRGFAIIGSPPDEITGRELNLVMTVSNQYQSSEAPFTLTVSISWMYFLRLVGTYFGVFITAAGLVFYLPHIYNVLYKKRYRHPKDFQIYPGQEITSQVIYPIAFIGEELAESKLILENIMTKIKKSLKSSSKDLIATYFIDPNTRQIDKDKLNLAIEDAVLELTTPVQSHLDSYHALTSSRRKIIHILVANEIILNLLNLELEKHTKAAFEIAKSSLYDLVALIKSSNDGICQFSTNEEKLYKFLQAHKMNIRSSSEARNVKIKQNQLTKSSNVDNKSQMLEDLLQTDQQNQHNEEEGVNVSLLAEALQVYAFKTQSLDVRTFEVHVAVREKVLKFCGPKSIIRFLKWDLILTTLSKIGQETGYGFCYKIEMDCVKFQGIAQDSIQNKTIVVQIMNKRKKILRELWLSGTRSKSHVEMSKADTKEVL